MAVPSFASTRRATASFRRAAPFALVVSLAVACGSAASSSHGPSGTGPGADGSAGGSAGDASLPTNAPLRIEPANATYAASQTDAVHATYKVIFHDDSGDTDVTSEASLDLQPGTLGQFAGADFTSQPGQFGSGLVRALARGLSAETNLTIVPETVVVDPSAPGNAPTLFGGAVDAGQALQLVYPNDATIVPPNLASLEIHFVPAPGQSVFQIEFSGSKASFAAYTKCNPVGGGCAYQLDKTFWATLADAMRGGDPVHYRVRGSNGNAGDPIGASPDQTIQFATEDLKGGLYYWNDGGAIMRFDYGLVGAPAEIYLAGNPIACVGCHALSRDGKRMAVGSGIPAPAGYNVYDVATTTVLQAGGQPVNGFANFFSFSPDGSQLLVSNGQNIVQRDLTSGQIVNSNVVSLGAMPDWSPSGKLMVYARPSQPPPFGLPIPGVDDATLMVQPYDAANNSWGQAQPLFPSNGQNNYYPAFSPDDSWIAFNRSPSDKNSFDNIEPGDAGAPDGELWAVPSSGTGKPVQLANGSGPDACSWPKWVPSAMTYQSGTIMWLTYSSQRAYGLRLPKGQKTQLWMIGFDPAKAATGGDPSFSAFWLPFQDLASGNHIAQWVTEIQRKPCNADGGSQCDPGQVCANGLCIPDIH